MNFNRLTIPVLIGLLAALAVSVGLNFILFNTASEYYLQLNATRLEPLGLDHYPTNVSPQPATDSPRIRVVFFGDSRAFEWISPEDLPQFEFINRGIGAQTSAQVGERFDDHVVPLQPQIIIIQVCINDLKTIPLFPTSKDKIIADCKANIERIVSGSRRLDATVILTTIFPLGELPIQRRLFWSGEVAEAIAEINNFIHSLEEDDVLVLDAAAILADERGVVRKEYSRDFLHLTKAGYNVLNQSLVTMLISLTP